MEAWILITLKKVSLKDLQQWEQERTVGIPEQTLHVFVMNIS